MLNVSFAAACSEPLWNQRFMTTCGAVTEASGVEGRGDYDTAGLLQDMMQNHMFQLRPGRHGTAVFVCLGSRA